MFDVQHFATADPPNRRALFVVDSDGSDPPAAHAVEPQRGRQPRLVFLDGSRILFRTVSITNRHHGNLHTIDPDGSGLTRLTTIRRRRAPSSPARSRPTGSGSRSPASTRRRYPGALRHARERHRPAPRHSASRPSTSPTGGRFADDPRPKGRATKALPLLALVVGLIAAAPAAADAPTQFPLHDVFVDVDPCTGARPHGLRSSAPSTATATAATPTTRDRTVITSSGYVGHGIEVSVDHERIFVINDVLTRADGDRARAHVVIVWDADFTTVRVERFGSKYIGRNA